MERRGPGHRAGIDSDLVVSAARELVSEKGADGLTMRGLATRLKVTPNALYSHVESKAALLDEILDAVLAEVTTPKPGDGEPAAALEALLASTLEVLLANRELIPLYLARQGARGLNARRLGGVMAELLTSAGVTDDEAEDAIRLLIIYTIGFAAFAGRSPLRSSTEQPLDDPELMALFARGLSWQLHGLGIRDGGASSAPGIRRRRR